MRTSAGRLNDISNKIYIISIRLDEPWERVKEMKRTQKKAMPARRDVSVGIVIDAHSEIDE